MILILIHDEIGWQRTVLLLLYVLKLRLVLRLQVLLQCGGGAAGDFDRSSAQVAAGVSRRFTGHVVGMIARKYVIVPPHFARFCARVAVRRFQPFRRMDGRMWLTVDGVLLLAGVAIAIGVAIGGAIGVGVAIAIGGGAYVLLLLKLLLPDRTTRKTKQVLLRTSILTLILTLILLCFSSSGCGTSRSRSRSRSPTTIVAIAAATGIIGIVLVTGIVIIIMMMKGQRDGTTRMNEPTAHVTSDLPVQVEMRGCALVQRGAAGHSCWWVVKVSSGLGVLVLLDLVFTVNQTTMRCDVIHTAQVSCDCCSNSKLWIC